jgi:hypothetical protein
MSSRLLHRFVLGLGLAVGLLATGCHTSTGPQFRVLGVDRAMSKQMVFVQVTNPAGRAMRLTHLAYTFAAAGTTVAQGELPLARDLPAGSAIVVEVPIQRGTTGPLSLEGELTAQLDEIIRIFPISAIVEAAASADPAAH